MVTYPPEAGDDASPGAIGRAALALVDVPDPSAHRFARRYSFVRNREVGFIFQGSNLIGDLSMDENVELVMRRGWGRRQ